MESIEIHRFGPITEGRVNLAPLTILVGPNGSGKSFAAMVIHSLSRSGGNLRWGRAPVVLTESVLDELDDESMSKLGDLHKSFENTGRAQFPKELFNQFITHYFRIIFERRINDNLESVFATDIPDLIKTGHRNIRLDVDSEIGNSRFICYSNYDGLKSQIIPQLEKNPVLLREESDNRIQTGLLEKSISEDDRLTITVPMQEYPDYGPYDGFIAGLFRAIQSKFEPGMGYDSHYLPAGRAGLLQSHEILTTGAFDRLSRVGLEPIEVPAFSGVVSDYLRKIVSLSRRDKTRLALLAKNFEEQTLDGHIQVERNEEKPHPTILFEQEGREFQLHLASTSVSELAPLILYTKYILTSNSTIVIEEPEAHLHPENQRQVAYFIGRLVNEGIRVIVTTHSDFFIEQLNNSIRVSGVSEDMKSEEDLADLPEISPNDVAVHIFSSDDTGGYRIQPMTVDGIGGIPMTEFNRVSEELYGESFKVDKLLQQELGGDSQ